MKCELNCVHQVNASFALRISATYFFLLVLGLAAAVERLRSMGRKGVARSVISVLGAK